MNDVTAPLCARILLVALSLGAGAGAVPEAAVGRLPATDAELEAAVSARLERDPALSALRIRVQAEAGRVELSGTVPSLGVRREAGRLAASQRGVLELANHLRLNREDIPDRTLALRVKEALRFHLDLAPPHLSVTVAGGVAHPAGEVGTIGRLLFLRHRLEEVEGLRGVDLSAVRVETRRQERVDGDDLRDAVLALLRDRESFPVSGAVDVENRDGVIVLTGTVPRLIDKMEALEVAALATDAERLRDEIRLDPTHGRMRIHDGVPDERRWGPDEDEP